jgi:hypothetical protein
VIRSTARPYVEQWARVLPWLIVGEALGRMGELTLAAPVRPDREDGTVGPGFVEIAPKRDQPFRLYGYLSRPAAFT